MMYAVAIGIIFLVAAANKSVIAKSPPLPSQPQPSKQVPFYEPANTGGYVDPHSGSGDAAPSNNLFPLGAPDLHNNDVIPSVLKDNSNKISLWRGSATPEIIPIGVEQRLGWSGATPDIRISGRFFEPVQILPYPPVPLPTGPDIAPASSATSAPTPKPPVTRLSSVNAGILRQRILF